MKVIGHNASPDWPKLGPSVLIATALVVAIRTARWASTVPGDVRLSDVDHALDKEIDFAVRVTHRVMLALLKRDSGCLFPQKFDPVMAPDEEDVQP